MTRHFALWLYRGLLPASVRRRIPEDVKAQLGVSLSLVSQRDLALMRLRKTARRATRAEDRPRALALWQALAIRATPLRAQLRDGTLARLLAQGLGLPGARPLPADLDRLGTGPLEAALAAGRARVGAEAARHLRYARAELVRARLTQALALHAQGQRRAFREELCRAIEAIPDQRVFKKEPLVLEAVRRHVADALLEDGLPPRPPVARARPLRIAVCLDVLKLSNVHTHSRVIFAICRNLMQLDPGIEIHVVVTNERYVVTTPHINASFTPERAAALHEAAREALPEAYGQRFFLHVFQSHGLSGLVATCKEIIGLAPDVLLFGGGHKGYFSNESRVVRHCLHDRYPTAFFFIQSNNEVDEKLDMIIARGPHPVIGERGAAALRIQPYPTVTEAEIDSLAAPGPDWQPIIVSATTGVRMDLRLAEQSEAQMRAFLSILDRNPGMVWHFVGAADPEGVIAANRQLAARVRAGQVVIHPVLPLEEFTALVSRAALFLHLPRFTGGSGGAGIARRAGVPILTFAHSDVSGRQPPETVFDESDVGGFVALAHRVLAEPGVRATLVARQFEHMRWISGHAAQGFYDCLQEAHRTGLTRLARQAGSPGRAVTGPAGAEAAAGAGREGREDRAPQTARGGAAALTPAAVAPATSRAPAAAQPAAVSRTAAPAPRG